MRMIEARAETVETSLAGGASLASLGAVRVHGEDAESFLNAQLSNTVPEPDKPRSHLAAWCDAKGRTLAVFRVLRTAESTFLLILPAELIPALIPRLRMFVLRARVEITDISGDTTLLGVFGDAARTLGDAHALPSEPGGTAEVADATIIRLPAPTPRYLAAGGESLADRLAAVSALDENEWTLAEIRAGLPEITVATQGEFVPQMLNLHWIGGIDFHKGCYPGQEVVARLQFRGQLKRRVYRASVDADAVPGDTVNGNNANEGMVLRVAVTPEGERELLAVIRVDAASETLTVRGRPLRMLTLPYPTPD